MELGDLLLLAVNATRTDQVEVICESEFSNDFFFQFFFVYVRRFAPLPPACTALLVTDMS
jgi:hypothetical protein